MQPFEPFLEVVMMISSSVSDDEDDLVTGMGVFTGEGLYKPTCNIDHPSTLVKDVVQSSCGKYWEKMQQSKEFATHTEKVHG